MINKEVYEKTCKVRRDGDTKEIDAEVLHFKPKEFLKIVVGKEVKLNLQYEPSFDGYIGRKAHMEFLSDGPKKLSNKSVNEFTY